jgi:hypothetical protein
MCDPGVVIGVGITMRDVQYGGDVTRKCSIAPSGLQK